jgi:small ligand-binding sensory domain FIST
MNVQDGRVSRFGVGLAADADLARAAEQAARRALASLGSRRPDLALVFICGPDPGAVAEAAERAVLETGAPSSLGGTSTGVFAGGAAVELDAAVAVWCAVLPEVRLRGFHLEAMPAAAGMAVVGLPEPAPDDAVALLFADPWSFPVDGFIEQSNVTTSLPFVGGLASGLGGRGATRLLLDGRVLDRGAVGAVLSGPVGARPLLSHGCRPVGPNMTVTAADGNVILGLAGVPALQKLESIIAGLGGDDQAAVSTGLQLGVAMDEYAHEHDRGDFLIRGIAGIDQRRGGIVVGDLVDVGRTVRFQLRDANTADSDLRDTLKHFRDRSRIDNVESVLLFSCNGRGRSMFATADHDPVVVRDVLGTEQVAGFFAAGEIGPVGGHNHVHGLTASMLVFGSGAAADRGTA